MTRKTTHRRSRRGDPQPVQVILTTRKNLTSRTNELRLLTREVVESWLSRDAENAVVVQECGQRVAVWRHANGFVVQYYFDVVDEVDLVEPEVFPAREAVDQALALAREHGDRIYGTILRAHGLNEGSRLRKDKGS